MKHGKRPTVAQCDFIASNEIKGKKLNPQNWLVTKDTSTEMEIVHRTNGTRRVLEKQKGYPVKRHHPK